MPENGDSHGQIPDKWVKISDIPSNLLDEWRKSHRRDGGSRARPLKRQSDPTPLSDEDDSSDDPGDVEDAVPNFRPNASDPKPSKRRVAPKKISETRNENSPVATRKSPRNSTRVDYREFVNHGFENY
jgi:hypothetical protein